jgi:hypothetical protein
MPWLLKCVPPFGFNGLLRKRLALFGRLNRRTKKPAGETGFRFSAGAQKPPRPVLKNPSCPIKKTIFATTIQVVSEWKKA